MSLKVAPLMKTSSATSFKNAVPVSFCSFFFPKEKGGAAKARPSRCALPASQYGFR
jgi:hypothetical protein